MTEAGVQLTQAIAQICNQRDRDAVLEACVNIIMNCIRQNCARRVDAEAKMNEIYGRGMVALMEHYDPSTGRRRSVVPFDQVISPGRLESAARILGTGPVRKVNGST